MWRISDYTHNVSLRMSLVMDEIGVNEKIVMKRRKSCLLRESIITLSSQLLGKNWKSYILGSTTEGTTTPGLHSDTDILLSMNNFNVIQDWSEWEHGKRNHLMIQDETVSPGYCLLQVLRDDVPLPAEIEINEHTFRDERGRILLKNTIVSVLDGHVRHGPAQSEQGVPGIYDTDYVPAFSCRSYPVQARQWLNQQRAGYWPSNDMIQYCCNVDCFVVAVGNKGSVNENNEWRISTSLAERCLMFNLNITQIRCYVLMKMILKTFITPRYPDSISSFMCKTVLFHCISNTRAEEWKDSTLLIYLSFCLSKLYNCVLNEHCPAFFIPENNLMMRRFSHQLKQFILEDLHYVIESNGGALLYIECDYFGQRLQCSLNGILVRDVQFVSTLIAGELLKHTALHTINSLSFLWYEIKELSSWNVLSMMSSITSKLINTQRSHLDSLIARQLCITIGSILASLNIYRRNSISYKTLSLMSLGLNSDVASSKLKLASVFYCIGDTERTELILKNIEECYDLSVVEPMCECNDFKHLSTKKRFNTLSYESNQENTLLKHITASCVRFLRCEVNCCPRELQHEMFRSTQEDLPYKTSFDKWMAVVDSLPFLYFLQYKTYSRPGKEVDKNRALSNLVKTIEYERNLGHRETALNLLGQCMENENCKDKALECYKLSLNIRERNNAAKFLMYRLRSVR